MGTKPNNSLNDVIIASLIGTGEMTFLNKQAQLMFYFEDEKKTIIQRYIKINHLEDYMFIHPKRNQCRIMIPESLHHVYFDWYDQRDQKKPNIKYMNLQVCLLSILLFGHRRVEFIEFRSTTPDRNMNLLKFYMEKYLEITIEISAYGMKFYSCKELFSKATQVLSMEELNAFSMFLDQRELKDISSVFKQYEQHYLA